MFLYVHKIRGEMVEKENEEKEKNELEENFNDLVKQLLWKLAFIVQDHVYLAVKVKILAVLH